MFCSNFRYNSLISSKRTFRNKFCFNFIYVYSFLIFQDSRVAGVMYSQKTSTQSLTIIFAILFLLCFICGIAYCKTQKRKRRAITAIPQELPKAWFAVRPELIVPRRPLDRRRYVIVQAPQLLSDNINREQFI